MYIRTGKVMSTGGLRVRRPADVEVGVGVHDVFSSHAQVAAAAGGGRVSRRGTLLRGQRAVVQAAAHAHYGHC